jgi:hypothetical protein
VERDELLSSRELVDALAALLDLPLDDLLKLSGHR